MFVVRCDQCQATVPNDGYSCLLTKGRYFQPPDGTPRLVDRGHILDVFLCPRCAARIATMIANCAAAAAAR